MQIYDRKLKKIIEEPDQNELYVKLLYNNFIGRSLVKFVLVKPVVSKINGKRYSNSRSVKMIPKFIKKNEINMEDYLVQNYKSFNEFFTRQIIPEKRPIEKASEVLISVADSLLSVYKISDDLTFKIKNSYYTVSELIQNEELAQKYRDGYCLIFRLTVRDYHHYCFLDKGTSSETFKIDGVLHTVNPIAGKKVKVYKENSREWSILKTENFGNVIQVEVGALFVGKIKNNYKKSFDKGEEKGYFEFGGSTVILLLEKDKVIIDEDIMENSLKDIETRVKYGERIGRSSH